MPNLDIQIKGLALCHFDESNGNWRVFFPKAENHDFKIIVEKFNTTGRLLSLREYVIPTATRMNLVSKQITGLATAQNNVTSSLNIFTLHNEPITLTSEISKYAGLLTLHNCFLKSRFHPDSPLEVDIWDFRQPVDPPTPQNPPTKEWVDRKTVATEFLTSFETDSDSSVEITMQTDFEIRSESILSVKQEDDVKYVVTFSNDCEGANCETESDFKFFYEIIDETGFNIKRRFELILVDPPPGRGRMGNPCGGIIVQGDELSIPNGL